MAKAVLFYTNLITPSAEWQGWIGAVFWIAAATVGIDSVRTLLALRK